MKQFLIPTILLLSMSPIVAQEATIKIDGAAHTPDDITAIQKVVADAVDNGWGKFDVPAAIAEYTPNAYWINAYGIEKEGREEIEKFLTRIFAAPGMRHRKQLPLVFKSIRFIRPDIAIVHTLQGATDQLKSDGTPEGDRKSHVFRLMLKQNGQWRTDTFQVLDERPGVTKHP